MLKHCDHDKKIKGSIGPAGYNLYKIKGVIETKVCLLPMVRQESLYFIRMFTHYKNNMLPFSGGILEQPNAYIEAMEVIQRTLNE